MLSMGRGHRIQAGREDKACGGSGLWQRAGPGVVPLAWGPSGSQARAAALPRGAPVVAEVWCQLSSREEEGRADPFSPSPPVGETRPIVATTEAKLGRVVQMSLCLWLTGKYNKWDKVDPAELFSQAPTEKKEANPKLNMVKFLQVCGQRAQAGGRRQAGRPFLWLPAPPPPQQDGV